MGNCSSKAPRSLQGSRERHQAASLAAAAYRYDRIGTQRIILPVTPKATAVSRATHADTLVACMAHPNLDAPPDDGAFAQYCHDVGRAAVDTLRGAMDVVVVLKWQKNTTSSLMLPKGFKVRAAATFPPIVRGTTVTASPDPGAALRIPNIVAVRAVVRRAHRARAVVEVPHAAVLGPETDAVRWLVDNCVAYFGPAAATSVVVVVLGAPDGSDVTALRAAFVARDPRAVAAAIAARLSMEWLPDDTTTPAVCVPSEAAPDVVMMDPEYRSAVDGAHIAAERVYIDDADDGDALADALGRLDYLGAAAAVGDLERTKANRVATIQWEITAKCLQRDYRGALAAVEPMALWDAAGAARHRLDIAAAIERRQVEVAAASNAYACLRASPTAEGCVVVEASLTEALDRHTAAVGAAVTGIEAQLAVTEERHPGELAAILKALRSDLQGVRRRYEEDMGRLVAMRRKNL